MVCDGWAAGVVVVCSGRTLVQSPGETSPALDRDRRWPTGTAALVARRAGPGPMRDRLARVTPSNAEARILDRIWTDRRRQQMATRPGKPVGQGLRPGAAEHGASTRPEWRAP